MAIVTKVKIGLIILSLFILVAIPLIKNNFYRASIHSNWKEITWEDFKGFSKPFSGWDASISSNFYLKYDSIDSIWESYSLMSNSYSWAKEGGSSNLLSHEQYHFNISELFARKLNRFINLNPDLPSEEYYNKLYKLRNERSEMQQKYDDQSNHSLINDQQAFWEYKIDSMLATYDSENRIIIDPFSYGGAFFPSNPTISVFLEDQIAYRVYALEKYGLELRMHSSIGGAPLDLEHLKREFDNDFSAEIIDSSEDHYQVSYFKIDSTNNSKYDILLTYNGHHVIELITKRPLYDSLGGYSRIVNSFLNSFTLQDQRDYWNTSSDDVKPQELSLSKALKKEDKAYDSGACTVRWFEKPYGFYGVPYQDSSSNIIIPYQFVVDSIQGIQYGLVKYGDDFIYSKPDSIFHLFTIPNDLVDPEISEFSIGYTLFKDSIEVCEQNYAQVIDVSSLFNSK